MAEVRMPKMGDGMSEGTITAWLKKEGDFVKEGEDIAEVETDKANVPIPAEESGFLAKIVVQVGETVAIGSVIAQIGEGGASGDGGNGAHASATAAPEAHSSEQAPEAKAVPEEDGARAPLEIEAIGTGAESPEAERIKASPLARRMAQDLGIDLARLRGTGPGGRIVERDIVAFQSSTQEHPAVPPVALTQERPAGSQSAMPVAPRKATPQPTPAETGQGVRPGKMREAIARRTVLSKQTAPHFYVTMVVEMDRALAMLKDLNADAGDGGKITVNDVIVKGCASALAKVPRVNASWTAEGTVVQHTQAHIGVAVGIDEGLIIPVIRDCQDKTLRQISAEAKALIGKARNNQLKPEEYSGGTFSVSNLGMMGVDEFIAIINPPEAAILAIGGIVREPVVQEGSDEIAIRSRMKVTLSADHRLLDGVVAARFLQEVKRVLEAPFSLVG